MNKVTWVVSCLAAALLSIGCAKPSSFRGPAYVNETHAYAVAYEDEAQQSILGPDWILDNYQRVPGKKKSDPATLKRKEGEQYETKYKFDLDDDGTYEDVTTLPSYDLLFKHRKTNGVIWLSTVPLSREYADKELRVLLSNYIDMASGSGAVVLNFAGETKIESKRFSARLLDKVSAQLSGQEALAATIEVANIDQLRLSPDARWEKTRIVLAKPAFRVMRSKVPFAVLMVAGYSNNPEDFEAQYPDFQRLLGKIHVLSDEQVMSLIAPALQDCASSNGQPATIVIKVAEDGTARVKRRGNLHEACSRQVLDELKFQHTGQERTIEYTYDWKPQDLGWLSKPTYEEAAPAPAPAPEETAKAADTPAPGEAVEAAPGGEAAPTTPTEGGEDD